MAWYVGVVTLYEKGKKRSYGATSRRVSARGKAHARQKLKKMFKFKDNVVRVSGIKRVQKAKR